VRGGGKMLYALGARNWCSSLDTLEIWGSHRGMDMEGGADNANLSFI